MAKTISGMPALAASIGALTINLYVATPAYMTGDDREGLICCGSVGESICCIRGENMASYAGEPDMFNMRRQMNCDARPDE